MMVLSELSFLFFWFGLSAKVEHQTPSPYVMDAS